MVPLESTERWPPGKVPGNLRHCAAVLNCPPCAIFSICTLAPGILGYAALSAPISNLISPFIYHGYDDQGRYFSFPLESLLRGGYSDFLQRFIEEILER